MNTVLLQAFIGSTSRLLYTVRGTILLGLAVLAAYCAVTAAVAARRRATAERSQGHAALSIAAAHTALLPKGLWHTSSTVMATVRSSIPVSITLRAGVPAAMIQSLLRRCQLRRVTIDGSSDMPAQLVATATVLATSTTADF